MKSDLTPSKSAAALARSITNREINDADLRTTIACINHMANVIQRQKAVIKKLHEARK